MEEGNSKMEIKILQTEEVPKAVQMRGVFLNIASEIQSMRLN